MSKVDEVLNSYCIMVEFLAKVFGKDTEVVLHDITRPDNSVIAIANSLSGREIGAPLTDFAIAKIMEGSEHDYFVNYTGKTADGKKLKSSSLFIRHEGKTIGMLCINQNINALVDALDVLKDMFALSEEKAKEEAVEETFTSNAGDLISKMLSDAISQSEVHPNRMSLKEKKVFLKDLQDKGFFLMKGSVLEIVQVMEVSEATVYRYLKQI